MKALSSFLLIFFRIQSIRTLYVIVSRLGENCFADEFAQNSVAIISYTTVHNHPINTEFEEGHFIFKLKNLDSSAPEEIIIAKKIEDKILYNVKEGGNFKLCVKGNQSSPIYKGTTINYVSLIIENEFKEKELPLQNIPLNKDLEALEEKIKELGKEVSKVSRSQKSSLDSEEEFSAFQIQNANTLLLATIAEIAIIILLMLYTCISLKKSLVNSLKNSVSK